MKPWRRALFAVWVLLVCAGWGHAQPAPAPPPVPHSPASVALDGAAHERARIHQQRQAIDRALQQVQTACYQRFAVEDCLRKERRMAHQAHAILRQRESALDAAERQERAAQRLRTLAEHEKTRPAPLPATSAVPGAVPLAPADRARPAQAQARARQQQEKRAAHQTSQADAIAAHAAGAAKARQLQDEKKAAAAQRKARVLQSQADKAAAGKKPSAPLSPNP